MINYQSQQKLNAESKAPPAHYLATVTEVSEMGVKVIFDGETTASNKAYKYNKSITFGVGMRVKVAKISGTYIVEYPI